MTTSDTEFPGITVIRQPKDNSPKRILFVEDHPLQMYGVSTLLIQNDWAVEIIETHKLAFDKLNDDSQRGMAVPDVISIDLGLGDKPEAADYGLELLEKIRKRWKGLPLIVHGTLVKVSEDIVRRIVAQGASYFYLGDAGDAQAFAMMLPYIAQGYVIYSPSPAARLTHIITTKPDPFIKNPEYWTTLKLLNEGKRYGDVAEIHVVGLEAIKARVKKIALTLEALNEIPQLAESSEDERFKPLVIEWYRKNRFRYGH